MQEEHCNLQVKFLDPSSMPSNNPKPVTEAEFLLSADHWLARARHLIPTATQKARAATAFPGRWKSVLSKLERVPACLSELATHPCFSRNNLCSEILQSLACTLSETIHLAERCKCGSAQDHAQLGKLQMQSDLDSLVGKLDLNHRDCTLLVRTGVLLIDAKDGAVLSSGCNVNVAELLARLQIGHAEAKHRALDSLLEVIRDDEKSVLPVLTKSNISAVIQFLSATAHKIRDKAATAICLLNESGNCDALLVSEGVLPPLIRLVESGSVVAREKALITLQRLSMSADTSRIIVGHGGVSPLIDICQTDDPTIQSLAAGTLRNLSAVPEVRETLAEDGIVRIMINLLGCSTGPGSKEYAAECLQNLTATKDKLRQSVVAEGGLKSLLAYIDSPFPQESAVGAVRNLVSSVPVDCLLSLDLLPRLVHVLRNGSLGAKQAAASAIGKLSSSTEMKKSIGELGCIPLLIELLGAKSTGAQEAACRAVAALMSCPQNTREIKRDEKSILNLVQLLDPSPTNKGKKYAVACLLMLSPSKKCKKLMISHGAIGYLKKLSDMELAGAKKLLERLEKGKFRSLFGRK